MSLVSFGLFFSVSLMVTSFGGVVVLVGLFLTVTSLASFVMSCSSSCADAFEDDDEVGGLLSLAIFSEVFSKLSSPPAS